MADSTFRQLLTQATDAAERPKALAEGHYYGEITGHEFGVSSKKQTPFVRFLLKPTEETSDVEEGANVDAKGDPLDLSTRELRKDFYITPKSLYRLSDGLDAILGKETGRSFDERIPETRGLQVMFKVGQRPSDDGNDVFNEVGAIVKRD